MVWNKGRTAKDDLRILSGERHPMYGKHYLEESRKKISEKAKKRWRNKDYQERMRKSLTGRSGPWEGKKFTEEHRNNLSISHRGNSGPKYTEEILKKRREKALLHNRYILDEMVKLKEKGCRIIPIDVKGYPKPDFIAIDGDKIYAVEVELGIPSPLKLEKYRDQTWFNDILWIRRDNIA